MEVYQVIQGPARVPSGTLLQLSDAQVSVRQPHVRALAGGWYMAVYDLLFEIGEVLTFCSPLAPDICTAFIPPEMQQPIARHPSQRSKPKKEIEHAPCRRVRCFF